MKEFPDLSKALPDLFVKRLQEILPRDHFNSGLNSFACDKPMSVRINTLKMDTETVLKDLSEQKIKFTPISWSKDALILHGMTQKQLEEIDLVQRGILYQQGLSSMLVPLILDPKPGEKILDLCAAPGSKTTQMAAMMHDKDRIVCVENIRKRFYKLKSVVSFLGVENVSFHLMDGRRFKSKEELFDKILVDAPCSSEGRFLISHQKTFAYWSLRKIKEMARKQKGLLLNASRLLKLGGVLVYSTCTFSPEENEGVIDWLLKKTKGMLSVLPIHLAGIPTYLPVTQWQGKSFDPQVKRCLRVLPNEMMEGFFIAKLQKTGD